MYCFNLNFVAGWIKSIIIRDHTNSLYRRLSLPVSSGKNEKVILLESSKLCSDVYWTAQHCDSWRI